MCRIRCVIEFLDAHLLCVRQGPKIFATTANLPSRIKRFRKAPVALDRRKDGIRQSLRSRGWRRQRQTCAKGSASSGHTSGLG
jgi:hypothetical protein